MERGRGGRGRGSKKRATLSTHYNIFPDLDSPSTLDSSAPPQRMHNSTPVRGGKARLANPAPHRSSSPAAEQAVRQGRTATFHSPFTLESPSASTVIMTARKRSKTFGTPETSYDGGADDEAHSKGGHSLRKRARIDYTQEMIDNDLGLSGIKNDSISKSNTTPSARGRKRRSGQDDSDGESEDVGSNPKRRRADKSPARAASARRRNTIRKPPADIPPYVDQPSDNDVQDTILVNVSMDRGPSGGESDQSPSKASESSTSSEGSEGVPTRVELPTPQVQPDDETPISQASSSLNPEADRPTHSSEKGSRRIIVVSKAVAAPEAISAMDSTEKPSEADLTHKGLADGQQSEMSQTGQEREALATFENAAPMAPAIAEPTAADELGTRPVSEKEEVFSPPKPTSVPSQPSYRAPGSATKQSGPARLKLLEPIYKAETPFATHTKLTPYEDEDTTLPGPYIEWVYPVDKTEQVPIPTPTPTPSPLEQGLTGVEWDGRRPLRTKEFFALYRQETKRREERGEPPISMIAFNNECARKYRSAKSQAAPSKAPSSAGVSTAVSSAVAPGRPALLVAAIQEETPRSSQPAESLVPTAAPSPAAADEDVIQDDGGEDEHHEHEPVEVIRNPSKQYAFPRLRDPSEIIDALEGFQDMETDDLYRKVAAAVEVLNCYQQEYNELKKILDDEENAKRRRAFDQRIVNWENRQKADEPPLWRRHFDDPVKGHATFEVRGARAPKPYIDDPILEHQREEDRIMAQAYGFKHNNHPTQVGRQNPEEQRWEMPETRLRERRKTEKGAELAEENVVEGKRSRRPRHISDQSKDPSRSGSPTGGAEDKAKGQRRRGRAAVSAAAAVPPTSVQTGHGSEMAKPKRVRGLKNQEAYPPSAAEIASSSFYSNGSTVVTQPDSRPSTASSEATVGTAETAESAYSLRDKKKRNFALENDPELEPRSQRRGWNGVAQKQASTSGKKRAQRKKEATTQPAPPPSTAPTSAPVPTASPLQPVAAPIYHNFLSGPVILDNPHPTQSGAITASSASLAPGPFVHTFNAAPAFPPGVPPPPPPPPAVKKPITKIKLTNNGPSSQASSRGATPANGTLNSKSAGAKGSRGNKSSVDVKSDASANGKGENGKTYAQMTKSEKMSYSMRSKSIISPSGSDQPDLSLTRYRTMGLGRNAGSGGETAHDLGQQEGRESGEQRGRECSRS